MKIDSCRLDIFNEERINFEISRILFKNTKEVFFVSLITPLLFILSLGVIQERDAIYWLIVIGGISVTRFLLLQNINFGSRFIIAFRVSLFLVGIVWGIGALYFSIKDTSKIVLILLFLIGFCGAALPTIAACKMSIKLMVTSVLLPMMLFILYIKDVSILPAFCAIVFFFIILIKSGSKISTDIEDKIKSQINLELQVQKGECLALTDDLTKIGNRRFFNSILKKISEQNNIDFVSILVLDIDHFKRINDSFGHDIGDLVLKEVAKNISFVLDPTACFARVGGEEFGVILQGKSVKEAVLLAKKIISYISERSFNFEEINIYPITLSIGVSGTQLPIDVNKAYKYADLALYKAKNNGRNCVMLGEVI